MGRHPNNIVRVMEAVEYTLADALPAYPGRNERYVDQVLRDSAVALSRPVIAYGLLGIHPCRSHYFNVSEGGFRSNGRAQPWPPDGDTLNIFFFGGSTAVGFGIEDHQTVPAQLQVALESAGLACQVYNFGSGNYTSRHEFLRFLDLIDHGNAPDAAVFLDGYNESVYAYGNQELIRALDALYQREKRRRRLSPTRAILEALLRDSFSGRSELPTSRGYTPEIGGDQDAARWLTSAAIEETLRNSEGLERAGQLTEFHTRIGRRVWNSYLDSVALTRALAERHGVQTLFVWQPVPSYATSAKQRVMERLFTVFPSGVFCAPVYQWLHAHGFPSMQQDAAFLELSELGRSVDGVLYVDVCHYSALFCRAIAHAIADKWLASGSSEQAVLRPAVQIDQGAPVD